MKEKVDEGKAKTEALVTLSDEVSRLFNLHFGEVLNILSSRFPHTKGDGSNNEKEFLGLRSKILRSGNNILRDELPKVISNYEVVKRFTEDTETVSVGQRVNIRPTQDKE
jgi:hypothetical protein|nr:MAG TPA: hypothetical protein [Caudoviricetes sp.]